MESEEIIRAYMLEPGDKFKMLGSIYEVKRIVGGRIFYRYIQESQNADIQTMGANSQEKLILITNKTKQNEHQN